MREVFTILLLSLLAMVQICKAQSTVIHPFGAVKHKTTSAFEVFPKETSSKILLLLPNNLQGNCHLKLVDKYGRKYWQQNISVPRDAYIIELAANIPPGSYRLFLSDQQRRSFSVSFKKVWPLTWKIPPATWWDHLFCFFWWYGF